MMKLYSILLPLLCLALCPDAGKDRSSNYAFAGGTSEDDPLNTLNPVPLKRELPMNSYCGVVTEVSKKSITIQGLGVWIGGGHREEWDDNMTVVVRTGNPLLTLTFRNRVPGIEVQCPQVVSSRKALTIVDRDGRMTVIRRDQQPLRFFPFSDGLGSGETLTNEKGGYSYRPSDVNVGDDVSIMLHQIEGVEVCVAICISRRPGGRVPPAPNDYPFNLHHERSNAQQDAEEHGIPLPEKYRPPRDLKLIAPRLKEVNPMPIPYSKP